MEALVEGREISRSGLENSASREAACADMGVSMARFLRGRLERGSAEVGMDSGIFSDMFMYQTGRVVECGLLMSGGNESKTCYSCRYSNTPYVPS